MSFTITVNEQVAVLLEASLHEPEKGIQMINLFSRSTLAPPPSALGPGTWVDGGNKALNRRVLASNTQANVFHTGFKACDSYTGGAAAMPKVTAPTLFILGRHDQMTPPKTAHLLVQAAVLGTVVLVPGGHQMMVEAPEEVLAAMRAFLQP